MKEPTPEPLTLTPWTEITACKWYERLPERYVHTHHLLLESGDLSREEIEAVTRAAASFVPVYDAAGTLLAEPTPAEPAEAVVAGRPIHHWRFQFSLQSLLLLMVVVSCAASCYGIYYRRTERQRQAVAAFDKFRPLVYENSGDVWMLDFRPCAVKPGDDDVAALQPLPSLEFLYLDGSPVTDAGLKHVFSLKKLKVVTVSNTGITQKGVDDLKRAIPAVTTLYCPPPPFFVPNVKTRPASKR